MARQRAQRPTIDPFTGNLKQDTQQMVSVSTGAPINRNLVYDKSEVDAKVAAIASPTYPIAINKGGTGQVTAQAALDALTSPASLAGEYLRSDGTHAVFSTIQAADVPTLNQNTSGSAAKLGTARALQVNLASTSSATFDGSADQTGIGVSGILPVPNGGTGISGMMPNWLLMGAASGATGPVAQLADNTTTSGFVLTSQGGGAKPTWKAASGGSSTPRWHYERAMDSGSAQLWIKNTTGSGAAVNQDGDSGNNMGILLDKGSTTTGQSSISTWPPNNSFNYYDYNPSFMGMFQSNATLASNTWQWFFGVGGSSPVAIPTTSKHFGFILKNNNGTLELRVTNADGSNQTITQINGLTLTNRSLYYARFTSASKIEFYVDHALVNTSTTNLPSGGPANVNILIQSDIVSSAGTGTTAQRNLMMAFECDMF